MGRQSSTLNILAMNWTVAGRETLCNETERIMKNKKLRANYWKQRLNLTMGILKSADPNWERWFDDDQNIPADADNRQIHELVRARVIRLAGKFPLASTTIHRGIFIWRCDDAPGYFLYSKSVENPTLYIFEFGDLEAAKSFIDRLPFRCLGYGVALDVVPAYSVRNEMSQAPTFI